MRFLLFLSFGLALATAVPNLDTRVEFDLVINLSESSTCTDVEMPVFFTDPNGGHAYVPGLTPDCIQFPQPVLSLGPIYYAELVTLSGYLADCTVTLYSDL